MTATRACRGGARSHDRLLDRAARGSAGVPPGRRSGPAAVLQALAEEVGRHPRRPARQPRLAGRRAPRRCAAPACPVTSTRRHELRRHEHPAVEPLVRYRELARLHAAHGWAWRDQWVRDGRFHPEYVPGGVVSGRWATRGGGALQIPKAVRAAVVAPPGRLLVVADAGQLEPRVLAALARDPGLVAATRRATCTPRSPARRSGAPRRGAEMKVALLSAMYGGGAGSPALAALRRRFPAALALLEDAARTGEARRQRALRARAHLPAAAAGLALGPPRRRGRGALTRLGQVHPQLRRAGVGRRLGGGAAGDAAAVAGRAARRGFAELVFFQHDEVVVEAAEPVAADAVAVRRRGRGRRRPGSSSGTRGARPARGPRGRQLRRPLTRPPQRRSRNS